jgi:hypothetical protein
LGELHVVENRTFHQLPENPFGDRQKAEMFLDRTLIWWLTVCVVIFWYA